MKPPNCETDLPTVVTGHCDQPLLMDIWCDQKNASFASLGLFASVCNKNNRNVLLVNENIERARESVLLHCLLVNMQWKATLS